MYSVIKQLEKNQNEIFRAGEQEDMQYTHK